MKIGVIGANGYVGSALCEAVNAHPDHDLIPVVREDDWGVKLKEADVIIYTANSGRRFYANNNPEEDFDETVIKTHNMLCQFPSKKCVLVSTISARTEMDTTYGRNRRACELFFNATKDLIVRLGPMYGGKKKAGALYDIIANKKVYQAETTKYAYVPVSYNAEKILDLIDREMVGLVEVGAAEGISLREIADTLGSTSKFQGRDDTQVPRNPPLGAPEVIDVIDHAREIMKVKKAS